MSVAVVALTKRFAAVVTDSKLSNLDTSIPNIDTLQKFRKVYKLTDSMVTYGIGNAGLCLDFFMTLENVKNDYKADIEKIHLDSIISLLREWCSVTKERFLFDGSKYSDSYAFVRVCGIHGYSSASLTMLVDAKEEWESVLLSPNSENELNFRIFPPSDVEQHICDNILRLHIQNNPRLKTPQQMIALCTSIVCGVSQLSQFVDDNVQYWVYDLETRRCQCKLFDYPQL